jgi:hypothetical protein
MLLRRITALPRLEFPTSRECLCNRNAIGILDVAADRQTARQARYAHAQRL